MNFLVSFSSSCLAESQKGHFKNQWQMYKFALVCLYTSMDDYIYLGDLKGSYSPFSSFHRLETKAQVERFFLFKKNRILRPNLVFPISKFYVICTYLFHSEQESGIFNSALNTKVLCNQSRVIFLKAKHYNYNKATRL